MPNKPATPSAPFRFDYSKYRTKGITVDKLDEMATFVFTNNAPSYWGTITAAIKMVIAIAYVITRKILIDQELEIEKQKYELDQNRRTNDDLNRDELD